MILLVIILFLILYFILFNNKFSGGLNNKMEILEQEISEMETNNGINSENNNINSENNNNNEYSYAISDTADLGNMYGNYSIPNIINLYIK